MNYITVNIICIQILTIVWKAGVPDYQANIFLHNLNDLINFAALMNRRWAVWKKKSDFTAKETT